MEDDGSGSAPTMIGGIPSSVSLELSKEDYDLLQVQLTQKQREGMKKDGWEKKTRAFPFLVVYYRAQHRTRRVCCEIQGDLAPAWCVMPASMHILV